MTAKRDKSRHSSTIAFLDFLFNLVLGFVLLVILLLLIVKQDTSKPTVENKNEFVLVVQWDDNTDDDVDTWVKDPSGNIISYYTKEKPGMFLQRDDTGRANKKVPQADGSFKEEPRNMEVVNFTSWKEGQYDVNLHLYRAAGTEGSIHVKVKLIKVNPYSEAAVVEMELPRQQRGNEFTALNFTLDKDGNVSTITQLPVEFIFNQRSTSELP